jgi:hypothetical protein
MKDMGVCGHDGRSREPRFLFIVVFCSSLLTSGLAELPTALTNNVPLAAALAANEDVWGLAAMRQINGPDFEFFEKLLPPLLYVNGQFRHYPIVLGAPGSLQKARFVSNGSGINLKSGLKTWRDYGTPVAFFVGKDRAPFGIDVSRLKGPRLSDGWLPVVTVSYEHKGSSASEEAFAAIEPQLADHGVTFVRFSGGRKSDSAIAAEFCGAGLTFRDGKVLDSNGLAVAWCSKAFSLSLSTTAPSANPSSAGACVRLLTSAATGVIAIATKPSPSSLLSTGISASYERHRRAALAAWKKLLSSGAQFEVPEQVVNDAWRAQVCQCFSILKSNSMNYSYANAYERLYQAECGDSVRALALYGHTAEAAKMIPPLLDYARDKLKFHNAGFKLQLLSHFYWLTRDARFLDAVADKSAAEVERILSGREKESGLFPKEQYCGDVFQQVYSLHSNGAGWRGLRDFAAVLDDCATNSAAIPIRRARLAAYDPEQLRKTAAEFRTAILKAVDESEYKDLMPPFVPVALFGEEKPYTLLTATMLGSYWDLISPYMLGSGIFATGSEKERAIIDYLQERGGVCMGLIRFDQHSGLFANEEAVDDLYGLRYTLKLLELDDVDRALVSFYGKLAQGLTRDTFVGAEGTGLKALDEFGRPMYLPPNTSANAFFLWTMRYLLIQDWDANDDGKPDTLRLCFATPRPWLEDGKQIKVANAPTAFGPMALTMTSHLKRHEIVADVTLPTRDLPSHILLRARVPSGWTIVSAHAGSRAFSVDKKGTVDISELSGGNRIVFETAPCQK